MEIEEYRSYEGRNIYSYNPVIQLRVDLGKWADFTTKDIPCFTEKLVCLLPGLKEHHCSRGKAGGFIERLEEGTYLGHVIEHIAIEFQNMAGFPVYYGSTRSTETNGKYNIVISYQRKEAGVLAAKLALGLVKALLEEQQFSIDKGIKEIQRVAEAEKLGPSTQAILDSALKRGIPVLPLGIDSFFQLGYGSKQKRIQATITSNTGCIGVDLAGDKLATKLILSQAGIPVPLGGVVTTETEALSLAKNIGRPVVVKPLDANHGKGVSINLTEEKQIRSAFLLAKNYSEKIIVEESISGQDYRLLVVKGQLVAAAQRTPPFVEGDGRHSIRGLIEYLNNNPLRGEGHEKPLSKVKVDSSVLMLLAKKNLTLESVPKAGQLVYLRENGNISTGGIPTDVLNKVHPFNAQLAVRCARIIGLDIAGIDLVTEDISFPVNEQRGAIIEVNAAPGIRMHLPPLTENSINVAQTIVDSLFPEGEKGRIPLVAVTGTNGKTTTTRMIGHSLRLWGKQVGMTTTDGVYLGNYRIYSGDMTGPQGARMVLQDPSTEVAILETARGGIIRSGLGYDWSDVAVLTNISHDHLGQDGVEDIEDLIYVKSLVLETVKDGGYVVLNGEDPYLEQLLRYVPKKAKVIYFALKSNLTLKKHLAKDGQALFVRNDMLIYGMGEKEIILANIGEIPSSYEGKALYNIQNALAAIGALVALGLPWEAIIRGLTTFVSNQELNPGRGNIWDMGDYQVLLDYGHNPAGYQAVAQLIKEISPQRTIGIVGVPGDRQEKLILDVGQIAGQCFDEIIIKEDGDLRGRSPLEVSNLLYQGALLGGMNETQIRVIPSEKKALELALEEAKPGDLIVIFYEKYAPLEQILLEKQNEITKNNQNLSNQKMVAEAIV